MTPAGDKIPAGIKVSSSAGWGRFFWKENSSPPSAEARQPVQRQATGWVVFGHAPGMIEQVARAPAPGVDAEFLCTEILSTAGLRWFDPLFVLVRRLARTVHA